MATLPSSMRALVLTHLPSSNTYTAEIHEVNLPAIPSNAVLVKTHAIALNPIDPLYTFHPLGKPGRIIGSDFAGVVVARGDGVPEGKTTTELGARVAGFVQGACSSNERPGAFAEYVIAEWDLIWNIPSAETMEDAAAISLCGLTAAQAIYDRLGLAPPFEGETSGGDEEAKTVFIYGASTSVGMYAAQLARLSSNKVRLVGAAGKARHAMLLAEPYHYNYLVDYRDSDWPEQVKAKYGTVDCALDCISEGDSVVQVANCVQKNGKMAIIRSRQAGAWKPGDMPIEPKYGAVWLGLGVEVGYSGFTLPASPTHRAFATMFYRFLSTPSADNLSRLRPNPVRRMPGGMETIVTDSFALLGAGGMEGRKQARSRTEAWMKPVSAEKLVYTFMAEEK